MNYPSWFTPLIHDPDAPHELVLRQQSNGRFNEVRCQCGVLLVVVRPEDGPDAVLIPYRAHVREVL